LVFPLANSLGLIRSPTTPSNGNNYCDCNCNCRTAKDGRNVREEIGSYRFGVVRIGPVDVN